MRTLKKNTNKMKAYIPEEVIEKVRSAFQIEKVIGEFIPLRRAGVNYKCNCPFHKDSNASFTVSPAKDMWKCFGCGEGGNVFTFVQKHEGITFPEAVRLLADRAGIRIPEPEMSDEERAQQRKRQSMEVALNFARDTYRGNIAEPEAEAFLATRGIPEDILDRYETGYAPGGRDSFLETARSYSHQDHVLMDAGLIGKNQYDQLYDRFQNRIVWPFHSPTGRIVGFTGRSIEENPTAKYLNSPDTPLFSKGKVLFGLWQAKKEIIRKEMVYLVEGQFDVMRMASIGVENVVCGSGTALTEDQARLLLRFTENVTLIYDADAAGIKATRRNAGMLMSVGMNVRAIALPEGSDPDSYFRDMKQEDVQRVLSSARDIITYLWNKSDTDKQDALQQAQTIEGLTDLIAAVPNSVTAGQLIKTLAVLSKTSAEDIKESVQRKRKNRPAAELPGTIENGFVGMQELREMADGRRVTVELTWTAEDFAEGWGSKEVLLVCGRPSPSDLQDLRLIASSIRTRLDISIGEDLQEPDSVLTLRDMARSEFDITVIREEKRIDYEKDEDGEERSFMHSTLRELGWTEFVVGLYEGFGDSSETIRNTILRRCCEDISYADDTTRAANMARYAKMLGVTKGALQSIADPLIKMRKNEARMKSSAMEDEDGEPVLISMYELPEYVREDPELMRQYNRYEFFPLRNTKGTRNIGYMFKDKGRSGLVRVGNFWLEPLIHIKSDESQKNRRIVELSVANRAGKSFMEFVSKEMLTLNTFEAKMWERGGYCFSNGSQDRLRAIIYSMADRFRECTELSVLGHSDLGFFAFSNGLYHEVDGEYRFDSVDDIGLVEHNGEGYYLPTFSRIYLEKNDDTEADHQAKYLKFVPGKHADVTFSEWADLMNEVYKINDNGKWAIIYAIMCAFRSDIFAFDRLFTALFFVGPTNSGKSKIAYSTRAIYMPEEAPYFNLNLGTYPALASLLERYCNVPVMLDEYNDMDIQDVIFQSLKAAVYDGEGRQKRRSADSKDVETTKVNAPIILLGQETPQRDDNSLANRCVICDVPLRGEWTEEEKEIFNRLKGIEAQGLHHLLLQILDIRPKIRDNYRSTQQACVKELTAAVRGKLSNCEALPRVLNTVSIFLAVCRIVEQHTDLMLPFSYQEFFDIATDKVIKQVEALSNNNKVHIFFHLLPSLINEGKVMPGRDYKIEYPRGGSITVSKSGRVSETKPISAGTRLLFIKVSSIYPHYVRMAGREALSQSSLQKYMESMPQYVGRSNSTRFTWEETEERSRAAVQGTMPEHPQEDPINGGMMAPYSSPTDKLSVRVRVTKSDNTSCVIFDYNELFDSVEVDLARDLFPEEDTF